MLISEKVPQKVAKSNPFHTARGHCEEVTWRERETKLSQALSIRAVSTNTHTEWVLLSLRGDWRSHNIPEVLSPSSSRNRRLRSHRFVAQHSLLWSPFILVVFRVEFRRLVEFVEDDCRILVEWRMPQRLDRSCNPVREFSVLLRLHCESALRERVLGFGN